MAAFNAAVLRGVPAELLIYPDETIGCENLRMACFWQRTFFEWLDMWLKKYDLFIKRENAVPNCLGRRFFIYTKQL